MVALGLSRVPTLAAAANDPQQPRRATSAKGRGVRPPRRGDAQTARAATPRPRGPPARLAADTEPRDGFQYERVSFGTERLDELAAFFDNLPEDPYMPADARYRLRRLSVVRGIGETFTAEATSICQGANVNPMFPDVVRTFDALEPAMAAHPAFQRMLAAYRAAGRIHPDLPGGIDAHAIRTLAVPGAAGEPAPEGIHRDGRRVLGIFVVGRRGIVGGATELHLSRQGDEEPLFREVLQPGEGVVLNDREGGVFHYTAKVQAAAPDAVGARDVMVLTC